MGLEENRRFDPHYIRPDGRVSMAEVWAKEEAEQKAAEARMIENAKCDARAVWARTRLRIQTRPHGHWKATSHSLR
jgi:hypothetical protein